MRNLTWTQRMTITQRTEGCTYLLVSTVLLSIILPLWG